MHRDFHPGNVLWRRGTVTGVVDWPGACTGPAVADVAHCRVNLLTFGTGAAQRFTVFWQQAAGAAHHPWADVVTITGFLDDLRDDWGKDSSRCGLRRTQATEPRHPAARQGLERRRLAASRDPRLRD